MDELKAITVINAYQLECNDNDLVYLKSDVDTVLAEKDVEIRRLNRVLWFARAKMTRKCAQLCYNLWQLANFKKWQKAKRRLLAKAKEYK